MYQFCYNSNRMSTNNFLTDIDSAEMTCLGKGLNLAVLQLDLQT